MERTGICPSAAGGRSQRQLTERLREVPYRSVPTHGISQQLTKALADRFRFQREIGRGGMATVYLAEDLAAGCLVAIKVLRPELASSIGGARFHREIEIVTRLRHPNILPLLGSGEVGKFLYYSMPYVAGASLQALLEREGRLPLARVRVLTIAGDIAGALDYAHAHNVVHRDIKPANVLLEVDKAVVCDFGVARAIVRASTDQSSSSGLVFGTAAYMSPEQATGRGEIDARSDIYALGCVVYEMLTGELAFSGPTPQAIIARHLQEPPRPIRTVRPEVSRRMEAAVLAALAKEPMARPSSARDFFEALRQA
jgi:serine/threonine protein kinase